MKISKQLGWLEAFTVLAQKDFLELQKLKNLYIIRQTTTQVQRVDGVCSKYYHESTFHIGLHIKYQYITLDPFKITLKKHSKLGLLQNYAHELAHIIHWYKGDDHTIAHSRTELKIYNKFLTLLEKQGYISEEKSK